MKKESVHFNHEEIIYVPCYQKNPTLDKPHDGPCFTYALSEASHDLQMVLSMKPDYVLTLKGTFDAKTQPYDLSIVEHNFKRSDDEIC